jgi:hypothetical protein
MLEKAREEVFVFRERDHAVADVARREHVQVFAEAAGGAAVVGDGDDGGELADEASRVTADGRGERSGDGDVALESTQ